MKENFNKALNKDKESEFGLVPYKDIMVLGLITLITEKVSGLINKDILKKCSLNLENQ